MAYHVQIAKNLRTLFNGGNWAGVNYKETLKDVDWQIATQKVNGLNSIATILYHVQYYFNPVMKVLQGAPLDASDKLSFNCPPINGEDEWQQLVESAFAGAESLAQQIEKTDDSKLNEVFADEKYGNYFRNLHGVIEHAHYHLGQISLLKKILMNTSV